MLSDRTVKSVVIFGNLWTDFRIFQTSAVVQMNIAPLQSGICFKAVSWKCRRPKPDPCGKHKTCRFCIWSISLNCFISGQRKSGCFHFSNRWQDVHNSIPDRQLFCNETLHTMFIAAIMEMLAGKFACLIAGFFSSHKNKTLQLPSFCNGYKTKVRLAARYPNKGVCIKNHTKLS